MIVLFSGFELSSAYSNGDVGVFFKIPFFIHSRYSTPSFPVAIIDIVFFRA
jgi:hypothetical protein